MSCLTGWKDVLRALLEAFLTGAETVIACLPDDSLVHALPKGQDRMRFTKESFETTKAIDIPQKHSRPFISSSVKATTSIIGSVKMSELDSWQHISKLWSNGRLSITKARQLCEPVTREASRRHYSSLSDLLVDVLNHEEAHKYQRLLSECRQNPPAHDLVSNWRASCATHSQSRKRLRDSNGISGTDCVEAIRSHYNQSEEPWPTSIHDTSATYIPLRIGTGVSDRHEVNRKPDVCMTPKNLPPALSTVLVPFELTLTSIPEPKDRVDDKLLQLLSLQAIALLLQPTRRFCFGVHISSASLQHQNPVADVVVVTRSRSLWFRIQDVFGPAAGLPQLGALLLYLSRARPSSLGFIEGLSPIDSDFAYPVCDNLRLSVPSQSARDSFDEVDLDFTNPLFVSKQPFSRATTVVDVSAMKGSQAIARHQATSCPPLTAKLAWLTADHFLDGRPVEERVLEQVKKIDPRSYDNVAQMRACYVLQPILKNDSVLSRTPVLIVMEGRGATMRQRPFESVRQVLDYLEMSWRTMQDLWRIGVAHRDISTSNVLRRPDCSSALVVDFEAAILFDPEGFPDGDPAATAYRPLPDWKQREKHLTATLECVPVAVQRACENGWRLWSLRLEVEAMFNLTARTVREFLKMGPLLGQHTLATRSHSESQSSPAASASSSFGQGSDSTPSRTTAVKPSTSGADNVISWFSLDNEGLRATWITVLTQYKTPEKQPLYPALEHLCFSFSILSDTYFPALTTHPLVELGTGPSLNHPRFVVNDIPKLVKEVQTAFSQAREADEKKGNLEFRLDNRHG